MIETWELTIPELTGDVPRRAYVYVPDSFEEDQSLRYPVLYMFDGHNVFFDEDATYGKSWGMLDYMDFTQTQIIIAAVECNHDTYNGRLSEYSPFSCKMPGFGYVRGQGKTTMDWFVNVFKPDIDANFPTIPDREFTFIAGSSMGGLMSLYAVLEYNDVFSRCAALSPSIWFAKKRMRDMMQHAPVAPDTIIYMDYGSEEFSNHEGMAAAFANACGILMSRGIHVTSRIVPFGDHSEASWERQVPVFMDVILYGLDV
ncbi:MAG: alpha/beta hydrolase [Clostridiales bacterium]|nr:alpha/beta hydrolase [Clostridiales bacterium]